MKKIHFIGGEKGGVGKSVLARVLAQYFIDQRIPFKGHDADQSHRSFARFYPDFSSSIIVDNYDSLDQLIESLEDWEDGRVLVDLAAQTKLPLLRWMDESGVMELAEEMEVSFNFWHVMDDSKDSVVLLKELIQKFQDKVHYVVVLNKGRGENFDIFHQSEVKDEILELGGSIIEMPRLHATVMQKIDTANDSFWAAINNVKKGEGLRLLERRRVRVWQQNINKELEKLEL